MPALTFRAKLILAFLVVIVGAVGSSLWVANRRFQEDLDRRLRTEVIRVKNTWLQVEKVHASQLTWGCRVIVEDPRLAAVLADTVWDLGNLAYMAARDSERLGIPMFSFCDPKTGRCRARSIGGVPQEADPAGAPEEATARAALAAYKERLDRFTQVVSDPAATEDQKAAAAADVKSRATAQGYLIEQGGLFQIVALPLQQDEFDAGSEVHCVLVVGVRMDVKGLEDLKGLLSPDAALAVIVGDRVAMKAGSAACFDDPGIARIAADAVRNPSGRVELSMGGDHGYLAGSSLEGVVQKGAAKPSAIVAVWLSTAKEENEFLITRRWILIAGGGAVVLAMIVATLLARGLTRPITQLVGGTKRIAKGDYAVVIDVTSRDELGTLTASFNEMARGLADRERYRLVLTKVVSKEVAHELMTQMRGSGLDFEGVSHRCSILFADIRGFTPLTEHMEPSEVISLLNDHMSAMVRAVERHKGVVNKFVGDEIIGIFGAPVEHEDDALRCVRAGMEMISEVRRMNAERAARGKKEFAIGVGINSGNVVCGVMGSEARAEYTVLGAPVNLTARLCSSAKPLQVVITKFTWELVKDQVEVVPLGEQPFKGFSEPIPVFEVRSVRPSVVPQAAGTPA